MRRFLIVGGLVLTALILLVQIVANSAIYAASSLSAPQGQVGATPVPAQQGANWTPPQRPVDFSDGPKGVSAISGAVTEETVRAYLVGSGQKALSGARNVSVTSVQFITVQELAKLESSQDRFAKILISNFPADRQIAYATLAGDFYGDEAVPVMHKGFCVFDVSTGNAIMSGALVASANK